MGRTLFFPGHLQREQQGLFMFLLPRVPHNQLQQGSHTTVPRSTEFLLPCGALALLGRSSGIQMAMARAILSPPDVELIGQSPGCPTQPCVTPLSRFAAGSGGRKEVLGDDLTTQEPGTDSGGK